MTDQHDTPPTPDPAATEGTSASSILETIKDAIDDFAVRAEPTVREVSARVAEFTSAAATKAAPLAKKAGEVTAEASEKLAEKSKGWAADVRSTIANAAENVEDAIKGDDAPKPTDTSDQPPA
jgi:hypothetical protein